MKYCCCLVMLSLVVLSGGCFGRNKPSPTISADIEESFKQRWIAKRMSELQAGGMNDPRQARIQATEEFRGRYEYIDSARAPDPVTGRR